MRQSHTGIKSTQMRIGSKFDEESVNSFDYQLIGALLGQGAKNKRAAHRQPVFNFLMNDGFVKC